MLPWFSLLLVVPAAILVGLVSLPNAWANSRVVWVRQSVTAIAGIQSIIAAVCFGALVSGGIPEIHQVLYRLPGVPQLAITVFYDGVASLMFLLVSLIGWIISRYSIRYLDGESAQGRYFRWTGFTIGSVVLMVLSGNLLMFVTAWVLTSLGLHQLLLHYGHRPGAKRAAWTKFVVSRIGDAALIAAMGLIYREFGTLDFAELFAASETLAVTTPAIQFAGFLLIAGAATKSAQFPFHTWLPQTMETPTPVSALMHAGIVNAGGYLIIRVSPLVSLTPWALALLAIIGGVSACLAAVIMMTQTSIKKTLAYSTIAQMGFMLLQCGLGAYSAAMLHILAHSLYKAYAFLSSGSVVAEKVAASKTLSTKSQVSVAQTALIAPCSAAFLWLALALFGIDPITKPGGLLLGAVLCLAISSWLSLVMQQRSLGLLLRALLVSGGLGLAYSLSFFIVDRVTASSLSNVAVTEFNGLVACLVFAGFVGMWGLHIIVSSGRSFTIVNQWQIHAANGFYLETTLRRLFTPFASR